jgi:hypothetical protein
MFAAKSHEAEQELPEGIPEPRNVIREWRRPAATGDRIRDCPIPHTADWSPGVPIEVRPDVDPPLAAGTADEARLDVR